VIADPPLFAGTVQVTMAEPEEAVARTLVGVPGLVAGETTLDGVTAVEGDEATLDPMAFVAMTEKM
jgi:hypothetical protein